jgi:nicotinate-nucleotide adenylyltransferase
MEEFELDEVLFVPCRVPPHKDRQHVVDARHRLAMLELAIEGDPRFSVSTIELDRQGVSFTVDTVRAIQGLYRDARIFFIIGGDSLFEIHGWKDCELLLNSCELLVLGRPGFSELPVTPESLRLPANLVERIKRNIVTPHLVDIASSDIRMRAAEGLSVRYLVTEQVAMYICEHNLYCR